jgi:hypothetical protein
VALFAGFAVFCLCFFHRVVPVSPPPPPPPPRRDEWECNSEKIRQVYKKDAVIFKAPTTLVLQYLWPQQYWRCEFYYINLQSHKLRYRLKGLWHRP